MSTGLIKIFDSYHGRKNNARTIDWFRILPFIGIHAGCAAVIWVGFSFTALLVAIILYCIRVFLLTAVYHRYFSHKSYELSRISQFVLAVLTMTAIQRGPLWWAAHHREHHLKSDSEDDPHSPLHNSFLWSHLGWFLSNKYFNYKPERIKDFLNFPELVFIDRFDFIVPLLFGAGLYMLGNTLNAHYPDLNTSGAQLLVWGAFISTVCVYHITFCINSLAHRYGSRRFTTKDSSRNNWWLALLTFGEGWHNNHHKYPISARQGFKWWEIDITYYILLMLSWVGVVKNIKHPPKQYC